MYHEQVKEKVKTQGFKDGIFRFDPPNPFAKDNYNDDHASTYTESVIMWVPHQIFARVMNLGGPPCPQHGFDTVNRPSQVR